jgi:DNA-binding IclR family transcriptional regulator
MSRPTSLATGDPDRYVRIVEPRSDNERVPRTTLQTVERALSFLEYVAQARSAPRLRDVATGLGLNITTVYHLFNTLQARGYVTRDADGTVRIGSQAALIYQGMVRTFVPGRDLRPIIEQLTESTEETSYLTSLVDASVVIQALVEAPQALRVSGLYVGYSGQEHLRASGKAVLAHLPADRREAMLRVRLAGHDEPARAEILDGLAEELEVIRRRGYAIDDQGYSPGVCCVAAPYFGSDGEIVGSVAVSAPAVRFPKARKPLTAAVMEAAHAASAVLGHAAHDAASQ